MKLDLGLRAKDRRGRGTMGRKFGFELNNLYSSIRVRLDQNS